MRMEVDENEGVEHNLTPDIYYLMSEEEKKELNDPSTRVSAMRKLKTDAFFERDDLDHLELFLVREERKREEEKKLEGAKLQNTVIQRFLERKTTQEEDLDERIRQHNVAEIIEEAEAPTDTDSTPDPDYSTSDSSSLSLSPEEIEELRRGRPRPDEESDDGLGDLFVRLATLALLEEAVERQREEQQRERRRRLLRDAILLRAVAEAAAEADILNSVGVSRVEEVDDDEEEEKEGSVSTSLESTHTQKTDENNAVETSQPKRASEGSMKINDKKEEKADKEEKEKSKGCGFWDCLSACLCCCT